MIAIAESTPGPLGVNMATYVGYSVSGIPGAVLASLALIVPSLIIIPLLARAFSQFKENRWVQYAFSALRAAVTGLIISAGITLLKGVLYSGQAASASFFSGIRWLEVLAFAVFMVMTHLKLLKKVHPVAFIALGALVGIVFKL